MVRTPFGEPSDPYVIGEIDGIGVAFLSRHGRGHRLTPTELNYRANIYGFKVLGVETILSASAVGSMKEHIHPTDLVFPDQFIAFCGVDPHKGRKAVDEIRRCHDELGMKGIGELNMQLSNDAVSK